MKERIEKLENQIEGMQEILIALIITQDRIVQFKLRQAYPKLDEMLNRLNL